MSSPGRINDSARSPKSVTASKAAGKTHRAQKERDFSTRTQKREGPRVHSSPKDSLSVPTSASLWFCRPERSEAQAERSRKPALSVVEGALVLLCLTAGPKRHLQPDAGSAARDEAQRRKALHHGSIFSTIFPKFLRSSSSWYPWTTSCAANTCPITGCNFPSLTHAES
jgi:hypothetical protein